MPRAGDVVSGKYRLVHPLGIGGMGTVWRAEHVALKQQVALKLLNARGANSAAIKRFQREAQIAASIRHRNIVYISDFGLDSEEPYIVMELLTGVPLSERMVVGEPLAVLTFMQLLDDTLQGLAAVHAAGVVHRDLKPENIFLVRESDGTTFAKLLDFGVSRSTERGRGHTITREGIVMGTPEYVSPEQARGRMADVRSDLYSLGVVAYEALSGRLPFAADNAADLIVALLNSPPLPLSTLRPELGEPLSNLLSHAIEREPGQRFQSAEEMRSALAQLVDEHREAWQGLTLPKRFLAPAKDEDDAPRSLPPMPGRSYGLPTRKLARWWLAAALLLPAVVFGFALGGGPSHARTQAQTPVAPSAPKLELQLEEPPEAAPVEPQIEPPTVPDAATAPVLKKRVHKGRHVTTVHHNSQRLLRNPDF